MTVIAEVREYSELLDALRSYQPDPAGLPLFSPVEIRTLGKVSLGAALGALGLKLTVVVDEPQLARIRHRLTKRKNARSNAGCKNARARYSCFRGNPEKARALRMQQLKLQSPRRRREISRNAARARWGS